MIESPMICWLNERSHRRPASGKKERSASFQNLMTGKGYSWTGSASRKISARWTNPDL
jgi:hypothetical protein